MNKKNNNVDILDEIVEMNKKVDDFLKEIEKVCKKYNMSIAHEDHGGAFIIEEFDEIYIEWLKGAQRHI